MAIALSILTIVAAIVPVIVDLLRQYKQVQTRDTDALVQRDLDVLHGPPTDGVQPPKVV
jgi:hypothetical protein